MFEITVNGSSKFEREKERSHQQFFSAFLREFSLPLVDEEKTIRSSETNVMNLRKNIVDRRSIVELNDLDDNQAEIRANFIFTIDREKWVFLFPMLKQTTHPFCASFSIDQRKCVSTTYLALQALRQYTTDSTVSLFIQKEEEERKEERSEFIPLRSFSVTKKILSTLQLYVQSLIEKKEDDDNDKDFFFFPLNEGLMMMIIIAGIKGRRNRSFWRFLHMHSFD